LLFSLILRFDRDPALTDLHASYRFILGRMAARLESYATGIGFQGLSDLTLGERKFSGNSQQRKRTHLLHHGTLLYAFDVAPVSRYLKLPPRQPEYRRGRTHEDFVANVPIAVETLEAAMCDAWQADEPMPSWPEAAMKALVEEKYATDAWVCRR
jgi:lipoate-protein ligase A